jgi:outer membrane receptor protein involved in Fe transport
MLLASVALTGVAASGQAFAQTADEKVTVTGSRIPQRNVQATSPITQVTGKDVTTQGVTKVEDLVNQLPQVFAAQNSAVSNGASGTATVSLRGLGSDRTLVLINGRRMGYGSPTDTAADLNQIPGLMVERIEVLTGGASAVYGSDALAGVVNFIMKKRFEGVQVDAQYSTYWHDNAYDGSGNLRNVIAGRAVTNPSQFALPKDTVFDGEGVELQAIMGANSADDKGNVMLYVGYRKNNEVLQRDRDYSACSLGANAAGPNWTCGGSGTTFPAQFNDFTGAFTVVPQTIDQVTGLFTPYSGATGAYNFGPLNYYIRPDERYTFGGNGNYQFNAHFEAYAELMFSDYKTVAQIAPSGSFFSNSFLNCGNPLLPANAAAIGCTPADVLADTQIPVYVGRRNVEGGGRQDDLGYESFRMVGGLRGLIVDGWDYDLSMQKSRVRMNRVYRNDFAADRVQKSLDIVDADPGPGVNPQCRSFVNGTDLNCVPYNIFTPGGVTQAALNYLQIPLMHIGSTTQTVVALTVNGDLGTIGITSPLAESSAEIAFGIEGRRDELESTTDANFAAGNGTGQGGPTIGLAGQSDVTDVFVEMKLPLVENKTFVKLLSIDGAFRQSYYDTGIEAETYKIGGEYAPTEDVRFRGSFQRAVRAANVVELFAAQGFNLFDMDDDPCDLTDPNGDGTAAAAVCQGVNPWQVTLAQAGGGSLTSPAGQYNFLQGGNPLVAPETGDTLTLGFVATPRFIKNLVVSVDYFNIEIEGLIGTIGATNIIQECYFGAGTLCNRIVRNPGNGTLWVGSGNVIDTNTNIGGLSTKGIDVNASYSFNVGSAGSVGLQMVGTWLDELITDPALGITPYDCAGFVQNKCGTPNPEWRHRFRATWQSPWDAEFAFTWRHYASVDTINNATNQIATGRLDTTWEAENYLDIATTVDLGMNLQFRAGVNNVFDNDPTIGASVGTTGNGNTFPQTYDAMGRYVFTGLNWKM